MAKAYPYEATRTEPYSNRELAKLTGVSQMSLYLWRQGSNRREPLPARKEVNGAVGFPVKSTLRWLKRYKVELVQHPDRVKERDSKSGPRLSKRPVAYATA